MGAANSTLHNDRGRQRKSCACSSAPLPSAEWGTRALRQSTHGKETVSWAAQRIGQDWVNPLVAFPVMAAAASGSATILSVVFLGVSLGGARDFGTAAAPTGEPTRPGPGLVP